MPLCHLVCSQNLEILAGVRRELVNRGFLHIPTVFIHPNCGVDCQRLRAAVNKLQGKLVETEGKGCMQATVATLSSCHSSIHK